MSTHTAPLKAEPAPLPANAYCHVCGQVLPPLQIQEYPKAMYKTVPKPAAKDKAKEEEEEIQTIIVTDAEEEKKKAGEGYSKDVPKPKHDEKPVAPPVPQHEHNKKS